MALRWGFKAEANWWSREMRSELGLRPADPLCPWTLAGYLGIPVMPLSAYAAEHPEAVGLFSSGAGQREFSAVTSAIGRRRFIIHNDAHDKKRQASNLAHEIAHALLMHPTHSVLNDQGNRNFIRDIEDEANWLGPALLISEEAALFIAGRMSVAEASDHYGASREVVQMRLNVCGARKRVA